VKAPVLLKKLLYICLLIFVSIFIPTVFANPISSYDVNTEWRLNFDSVTMPNRAGMHMGLVGVSYLIDLNPWFFIGPGVYGAVTGEQGGLYVFGAEAGVQQQLFNNVWCNAGIFFGGGGGRSSKALVDGGLMLRPHVGLMYNFNHFRVGLDYSKVYFPQGTINSNQIAFSLAIPNVFYYVPAGSYANFVSKLLKNDKWHIGFTKNYIALIEQTYYLTNGARYLTGKIDKSKIGLIGIEWDHFFTTKFFTYIKGAGGFSGQHNGYMDVLGGIGYQIPLQFYPRISINPRVGIGAGGGGNVDSGGGVIVEPSLGLQYQFTKNLGVELTGGYLTSPSGHFNAYTLNAKLIYAFLLGDLITNKSAIFESSARYAGYTFDSWRVHIGNQTYIHPQRRTKLASPTIQLVKLQIDNMLTKNIYITGQATSAYLGHAGGYSAGMIGLGLMSNKFFNDKLGVNVEVLAGAGGGGRLDVAGGAIINPQIGINYFVNNLVSAQLAYGRIFALKGRLSANTIGIGLLFNFDILGKT
jgi:hypothetical protein